MTITSAAALVVDNTVHPMVACTQTFCLLVLILEKNFHACPQCSMLSNTPFRFQIFAMLSASYQTVSYPGRLPTISVVRSPSLDDNSCECHGLQNRSTIGYQQASTLALSAFPPERNENPPTPLSVSSATFMHSCLMLLLPIRFLWPVWILIRLVPHHLHL